MCKTASPLLVTKCSCMLHLQPLVHVIPRRIKLVYKGVALRDDDTPESQDIVRETAVHVVCLAVDMNSTYVEYDVKKEAETAVVRVALGCCRVRSWRPGLSQISLCAPVSLSGWAAVHR